MWVFDVHAESQLLEDPPLRLDNLVFQLEIGSVQHHRHYGPVGSKNDVVKNVF